jgi:dihydrodipicolinate synthase/N-acetylneuraminate lyase
MPAIARGAYGILLTTYTAADAVHLDDLSAQADFVASTAQGVVWPVLASEFFLMNPLEIQEGFPAVADGNRGRVPFVAGVSAQTTRDAAMLAAAAARAGADAVVAMPPFLKRASGQALLQHFQAIAEAGLPIVVQNAEWLAGSGKLGTDELRQLAAAIPLIQHLKEEAPVLPQTISRALTALPGVFTHVFGGGGGRYLLDELHRGGSGTMLACEWADVFGAVAALAEAGDMAEARRLHGVALTGVNLEAAYGMAGAREVLRRRTITRSVLSRYSSEADLDRFALDEIAEALQFLAPYLRWPRAENA